jgi:hypothetical protein
VSSCNFARALSASIRVAVDFFETCGLCSPKLVAYRRVTGLCARNRDTVRDITFHCSNDISVSRVGLNTCILLCVVWAAK